jgi:Flp pilus assembly protein TadG
LVELALIIPLLLVIALGIFDFARAFTAAITIEAAAREAADFGTLYPWNWDENRPDNITATEVGMQARACSAASTLTDYLGSDPGPTATCTNPAFSYEVVPAPNGPSNCYDVPRDWEPCKIKVTLDFEFRVIVPLSLKFGDTTLGLPDTVQMSRSSVFAVSDFEIDVDPSVEPSP